MSTILSRYGLTRNPFLEERHDFPMVDREEDWNHIKNVLTDLLIAKSCGITVIFGDYGMGKTFSLLKTDQALQQDSKFVKMRDKILSVMLKATGSQLPANYLGDLLIRIIRKMERRQLEEIAQNIDYNSIDVDLTLKNVLEHLAQGEDLAWDWLIGRSLSKAQLNEIGARYKIMDAKETYSTFAGFLKILKACNYGNLVILFDEWEYLLSISGRSKILSIVHDLQQVWDAYNEAQLTERDKLCKVIFVIGTSADAWQKFLEMVQEERNKKGGGGTETFLRRVPQEGFISLSPLKDKDIREFLLHRLKNYRVQGKDASLAPFEKDYVKFISAVSWGIPSRVLSLSALIIKVAAEKGVDIIDPKFAEQVLREHGLYAESEEAKPTI